jgi:hypothetical protein
MPGIKRLRNVARSFAQHALSGNSYDTPERTLEQRRAGVMEISVALVGCSDVSPVEAPGLRSKFAEILRKEGFEPSSVVTAHAVFGFVGQQRTALNCQVIVATPDSGELKVAIEASDI